MGRRPLVVHHPLFLTAVHGVAATTPKGRALATAGQGGVRAVHRPHQRRPGRRRRLRRARPRARAERPAPAPPRAVDRPRQAHRLRAGRRRPGGARRAGRGRRRPDRRLRPRVVLHRRARAVPAAGGRAAERSARSACPRGSPRARRGGARAPPASRASSPRCCAAHPYEEPAYDVVELADPHVAATGPAASARVADAPRSGSSPSAVAAALPATAARGPGGRRPRPAGPHRRRVRRVRRLAARHGRRGRRRRLRDRRPAPPPGVRAPRDGRPGPRRRRALGDGVAVAARSPSCSRRPRGRGAIRWTTRVARSSPTRGPSTPDHRRPRRTEEPALNADPPPSSACSTSRRSTPALDQLRAPASARCPSTPSSPSSTARAAPTLRDRIVARRDRGERPDPRAGQGRLRRRAGARPRRTRDQQRLDSGAGHLPEGPREPPARDRARSTRRSATSRTSSSRSWSGSRPSRPRSPSCTGRLRRARGADRRARRQPRDDASPRSTQGAATSRSASAAAAGARPARGPAGALREAARRQRRRRRGRAAPAAAARAAGSSSTPPSSPRSGRAAGRRGPALRGVPPDPGPHRRVRVCEPARRRRRRGRRRLARQPRPGGVRRGRRDADTGEVLAERAEHIGMATNNVAEYRGLIAGLEAVARARPRRRGRGPDGLQARRRADVRPLEDQAPRHEAAGAAGPPACRRSARHLHLDPARARTSTPTGWSTRRSTPRTASWSPRHQRRGADRRDRSPVGGRGRPRAASPVAAGGRRPGRRPPSSCCATASPPLTAEKRFSGGGGSADPGAHRRGPRPGRGADRASGWPRIAEQVDAVVASPLRRTRETAEIVGEVLGSSRSSRAGFASAASATGTASPSARSPSGDRDGAGRLARLARLRPARRRVVRRVVRARVLAGARPRARRARRAHRRRRHPRDADQVVRRATSLGAPPRRAVPHGADARRRSTVLSFYPPGARRERPPRLAAALQRPAARPRRPSSPGRR